MASTLTDTQRGLVTRPNIGHLATVMPDGSPQVSAVWIDLMGEEIVVNTAMDRQKTRNIRRDPRVAISIADAENPYSMVAVRGTATLDETGADEHADAMARKYVGAERYEGRMPGERRVLIRIRPLHVAAMGDAAAEAA
jgi:PPOX class probable F420-dependent enzyme